MTDISSRTAHLPAAETAHSAVSWGAVLSGAVVSAAISLMLLAAGAGLGFTSISPWANAGVTATTFGIFAVLWLALIQIISAGSGGYIAGRLRTKRIGPHTDEIGFRDTAHGFLAWAVGAVIGAVFLASAAASIVSGTAQLGATAVSGAGSAAANAASQLAGRSGGLSFDPSSYVTDTLFRSDRPNPATSDTAASRTEVGRIVAMSVSNGDMSPADRSYVARVIAAQTGLNQVEAEKRVNDSIEQVKANAAKAEATARATADQARKGAAQLALATFIAMLIGALASGYGATLGGRARDKVA